MVYHMIRKDQVQNKNRKTLKYRPSTVTIKRDIFMYRDLGFIVTTKCTYCITKCINVARKVNLKIISI